MLRQDAAPKGAFAVALAFVSAALALAAAPSSARAPSDALRQPEQLTVGLSDELLGQLAPDGRHLYFVSNRNATNQIFVQDLSAAGATLLFDESADVTWPRLSPDGKRLLYISFRDDAAGQLCVRDLARLERRCLDDGSSAVQAQWFPDGKSIALVSRASLHGDLRLERVEVRARRLAATPLLDRNLSSPAISPDGRWLAFVPLERYAERVGVGFAARASRSLGIARLDGASPAVTPLALALPGATGQPSFSADGRYLYVTQYLSDSNRDGKVDGGDHGVLFRVPFASERDDAPARAAAAPPEQLTNAGWNCQYPSPARERLVMTCTESGSLDLYALPLDGVVPAEWSASRLRAELEVSRRRLERSLLLTHLERSEPEGPARAALTLELIALHFALGEDDSAAFYIRRLDALADAKTAGLAPVLLEKVEHRRAQRALDHGRLNARFIEEEQRRLDSQRERAGDSETVAAARGLLRSEIADTLGDKDGARAALEALLPFVSGAAAPPHLLHAFGERADALYRELDDRDALFAAYRALAAHPALNETDRAGYARAAVLALARGLGGDERLAAVERARPFAEGGSALAFAVDAERALSRLDREALLELYRREPRPERRRRLVADVIQRADAAGHGELAAVVEELARLQVGDVARGTTERRRAEKLYRLVVEERAYRRLAAGRVAEAHSDFLAVTEKADSLESHVGYLETGLTLLAPDLEGEYARRFDGKPNQALARFARAYLSARTLPALDGQAHARTVAAAVAELAAAGGLLRQKSEVQALWGTLLHERYLRTRELDAAEEANLHYLLALELAHENPRYRAMILEELALLHAAVGNHRIALGHFEEREKLPFIDDRVALAHRLFKARSLLHVGRDADAAREAELALTLAEGSPALERFRALALDRAALYNLSAGKGERASELYARAAPLAEGRRNLVTSRLAHAAAALAAKQPAEAVADLALVDRWLADPAQTHALAWPHASDEEVRLVYRLLALGLRARAHRELGQLPEAARALGDRRDLLTLRLGRANLDEDLAAVIAAEAELAEVARARGDAAGAARLVSTGLAHAEKLAARTATPLPEVELLLLSFAADLRLDGGARASDFSFDVAAKLRAAYDLMIERKNPAWRADERRFAAYLTLLALDGAGR